ncbi:Distal basal body ring component protein [Magnetospirillum sp. LM-5]|uniref:flagellar basal body P-ring formation chaperone FlgA n=1 Tax=Magnetospirillum sp. LM-5 TaxID=2681466 RepID=UPI0013809D7E|nr:flagellar basal body P-ring formation chaperone FlgA [Magnetospirillum sp. LM-5]CAA7624128.1 Distal basal body ring component protein [Magnetospirillum sp. LM-5]
MKRFLAILTIALAAAAPALAERLPVTLKQSAMIEGDMVKLGDLWDNLGTKGDTLLAPAPQPGKRIVADARWLVAVAQSYAVDWQPASNFDRIVIERSGQMIDPRLIETELREALAMEGVSGNFSLEVANRQALAVMVPAGQSTEVAIRDLVWDARNSRFAATVEVPAGSPTAIRQRVSGRIFTVTRIPVLTHAMTRGDVITEKDVQWAEVREEIAHRSVATDPRELIGQEPRFQVRAGQPVRLADLQRPVLVTKNSLVTISLKTPFMTLTSQGRAVEDGGKGDVIRITNLQTKRTIEAIVDGPGMVAVTPGGTRQLSH